MYHGRLMKKRAITKTEGTLISVFLLSMVVVYTVFLMFWLDASVWVGLVFAGVTLFVLVVTSLLFEKTAPEEKGRIVTVVRTPSTKDFVHLHSGGGSP